ncbi:PREDICTED: calmodulin-regulated spectrin-associated protein 3, partial [Pseudopodoces humilis]|uniref:calmodulin-regulated spectrin-associated protein 3 n=1 Tax=Pseudopodoces humilis TaxID=181119 RepID=UPI0006B850EE
TGYGGAGNVPEELRDPFYTDQYAQEHLKPPVERLLLASDIYCRAWSHALATPCQATPPSATPHPEPPPQDLGALLALLAGRGVPPTLQGVPVRPQDLQQRPIRMGAHLALIDSLMAAFVAEATRNLGAPPGAPPGPQNWEPKILGWLDTVNRKLQESTEKEGGATPPNSGVPETSTAPPACAHKHAIAFCLKESGNKPPVIRYRKDKGAPPAPPPFPPVRGLQDLASGGVLAAAIHFYCPQSLRLEEIRLGAPLALPDRLHNLGLVRDFGARHLRTRCPLAVEDLLYMAPALKLNVGAFLAELFLCFEVLRPPFVTPRQLGGGPESPATGDASNPKSSSPGFNFRHPLLAGGGQPPGLLPHSPSLPHGDGFGKGWSKRPLSHPLSQAVSFSIPFGLDSDVDIVMGNPVGVPAGTLARSASSDSLAPPRRHPRAPPATPTGVPNGVPEPPEPPSIEEALQIIHSSERLLPDGAPDAFFLHSPEPPPPQNPPGILQNPPGNLQNPPGTPQNPPGNLQNPPGTPQNPARPMTSFAERKKKLEEATNAAPSNCGGGPAVNLGGVSSTPGGPPEAGGGLSAEMSQLGARLEEKRRAIEAQKKRIEAIFAKHRQRLGQSALQRLRHDEEGASPAPPEEELSLGAPQKAPPAGQYEAAVARLSAALSSLQLDMQRLTQQQERLLLEQRPHGAPQAWVIPLPKSAKTPAAPPKNAPGSPAPARRGGGGGGGGGGSSSNNAGSAAPATTAGGNAASVAISGGIATGGSRKAPPRSPRRPRPAELRLPPLTRVLTPPHDVDTLPHLRRFSPSQVPVQTRSSLRFADGQEQQEEEEEEEEQRPPATSGPPESPPVPGKGTLRARACGDGTSDVSLSPGEKGTARGHRQDPEEDEEEEEEEEEGEGDSLEGSPTEGGNGGPRASVGFFCKEFGGGSRRGEFTRLEYERRQQLKLMEELEKVLRPPRGTPAPKSGGGGGRGHPRDGQNRGGGSGRPRPRCCDDSALARSPPKGLLGSRLSKVYSQSSLSLSSVAEPGGGRGTRLYKEPTARSNRPLIQNALAHCVLAGTPNAPLRAKVLQWGDPKCDPTLHSVFG